MIVNSAGVPHPALNYRSSAGWSRDPWNSGPDKPPLRDHRLRLLNGQVDVWVLDMAHVEDRELYAQVHMLDFFELGRLERLRTEFDCKQFVAGRLLIRRALSRYTAFAPQAWRFGATAAGRPYVAGPAAGAHLFYSLSHAEGLLALAVALHPQIGIDAEPNARAMPLDQLEHLLFRDPSSPCLFDTGHDARRLAFVAHRCLQGALLKARGQGFDELLASFGFKLNGEEAKLVCTPEFEPAPQSWWLRFLDVSRDHTVALAARHHHAARVFRCEGFP